jgi:hypothetical protein
MLLDYQCFLLSPFFISITLVDIPSLYPSYFSLCPLFNLATTPFILISLHILHYSLTSTLLFFLPSLALFAGMFLAHEVPYLLLCSSKDNGAVVVLVLNW